VFRKVSDLKRERELAERRKNEPKLDQSQDHLVRKIFSRFRKGGSNSATNLLSGTGPINSNGPCGGGGGGSNAGSQAGTPSRQQHVVFARDVERGDQGSVDEIDPPPPPSGGSPRREHVRGVKAAKEDETGGGSRSGSAKSKWGRMMKGSSNNSSSSMEGAPPSEGCDTVLLTSGTAATQSSSSSKTVKVTAEIGRVLPMTTNERGGSGTGNDRPMGTGNKVYPKLSRVPERGESVDDGAPLPTTAAAAVALPSDRSRLLLRSSQVIASAADYSPPSPSRSDSPSERVSPAFIIESFSELKHEVRTEVQRINHKMSRLEDILTEILVRLTPPPTPVVPVTASSTPAPTPLPPPAPRSHREGRPSRSSQVAPAPISSEAAAPYLVVTAPSSASASSSTIDEVEAIAIVGSSTTEPTTTQATSGRTGRVKPQLKGRPKSAGSSGSSDSQQSKLSTQFQEYV